MFNIGMPEVIIILALALLIFGPKKLPEIGKSIGQCLRELRKVSIDIPNSLEIGEKLDSRKEMIKNDRDS
ncbi:twin-arginine translocase TatA/TatE family subunit [bacterium]|nr:twin-arginine translocase TatA/TatE family subunit [bacterium]